MTVELKDECLLGLKMTPERIRLGAAIGLFVSEEATLGQAANLAGISQSAFLHELGQRRICVHYDVPEFEEDLRTLERLGRLQPR